MGSSLFLSQEQRTFQLRLAFGLLFLLSLLYAVVTAGAEVGRIIFGSTAQATVIHVSDPYYRGHRVTSPRVDYEYFDAGANAYRRDIYYAETNDPWPKLGQTLDVEYILGEGWSSPLAGRSRASYFWPIIPPLVLGSLLALSFSRQDDKRSRSPW